MNFTLGIETMKSKSLVLFFFFFFFFLAILFIFYFYTVQENIQIWVKRERCQCQYFLVPEKNQGQNFYFICLYLPFLVNKLLCDIYLYDRAHQLITRRTVWGISCQFHLYAIKLFPSSTDQFLFSLPLLFLLK